MSNDAVCLGLVSPIGNAIGSFPLFGYSQWANSLTAQNDENMDHATGTVAAQCATLAISLNLDFGRFAVFGWRPAVSDPGTARIVGTHQVIRRS